MTDQLFKQETPAKQETPSTEGDTPTDTGAVDQNTPLFKVGDREYDAQAAAKDIAHKQAFIEQILQEKRELEQQMEQLQEKSRETLTVEERLQQALSELNQQHVPQQEPSQETETVDTKAIEDQLRKIAEETSSATYEQRQQKEIKQRNLNASIQAAKEALGDGYEEALRNKGKALNLTDSQIQALAEDNPSLFIETFARKKEQSTQVPDSRNGYKFRKNTDTKLPRITGYWHRAQSVEKLREAEQAIRQGIQDGSYKPKTF